MVSSFFMIGQDFAISYQLSAISIKLFGMIFLSA